VPERAAHPAHAGTIGETLDEAVTRLAGVEIGDPRREAMALWAAVAGRGMKPGAVWLDRGREPAPDVARRFDAALERRLSGVPFAYAVGRTAFRTLDLELDRRALIPRPETEGLVELVLRETGRRDEGKGMGGVVADIGTGCGCIALSLAVEGNFERVIAIERSGEAAALARENVALVRPPVPVEVREGDLLTPLAGERCRAIVSNPPYLTEAEYLGLDPSVRRFEPLAALVSGPDGLVATRALLAGARGVLEPGGRLALEVDERRAENVARLARELAWSRVQVYDDLFGRPRYVLAILEEDA
jgi:release factor glutamine methyltransferase